ncbi:MAG: M60 family metallopeptidase [Fimbriimonadales bacterium]
MLLALVVLAAPLLDGVNEITAPGIPGPLVVFGDNAQVVVSAPQGKFHEAVVAQATYGKGRIVAFGHGGYLGTGAINHPDTKRLLNNTLAWLRKGDGVVGIHRASEMENLLMPARIPSRRLSEMDLANLEGISVLIIDPNGESPEHAESIRKFVNDGGGLLIAGLGWGWLQLNPGKRISEHPCNVITVPMGIAWGDGYLDRNAPAGFRANAGPAEAHAGKAFTALRAGNSSGVVGQVLTRALETLPFGSPIVQGVDRLAMAGSVLPTEQKPIKTEDVLPRLKLALDLRRIRDASPTQQQAHPAAAHFPGLPDPGWTPVTKTVTIETKRPRWHGVGMYAPPGSVIKATTVAEGLNIRIGAHSDRLWHLDDWKRAPEIDTTLPLAKGTTEIASAFGGLIYLEVPRAKDGTAKVTISGAIESAHYVHGKTHLVDWRAMRHSPAPWAELESEKIILTVPAAHIRTLDNPTKLMEYWDKVADACADLATISRVRSSPERYVADVQISAGYMHAGYPIMTHLDAAPRMVDINFLTDATKGGDWGLFHEIGHNHQHSDWTFDGTGEVTVNLFTLYIIETVVGRVPGYKVRFSDEEIAETFRKHRAAGAPYEKWKGDAFLALTMYIQLQREFGWGPFKKVFAEYRTLSQSERPKNDNEKRDQWMVRLSKTVGKNLAPFFKAWGVPTSVSAQNSIRELPVWNHSAAME